MVIRQKIGYVNGITCQYEVIDSSFPMWKTNNTLVMSFLVKSIKEHHGDVFPCQIYKRTHWIHVFDIPYHTSNLGESQHDIFGS